MVRENFVPVQVARATPVDAHRAVNRQYGGYTQQRTNIFTLSIAWLYTAR